MMVAAYYIVVVRQTDHGFDYTIRVGHLTLRDLFEWRRWQ